MSSRLRLCAVALLALVFASVPVGHAKALAEQPPARAQAIGQIFGKVTDKDGGVMPGVTVTVTGTGLQRPLVAVTNANGAYTFVSVPIGTYSVTFELKNFKKAVRAGVVVTAGFAAPIDMKMEIGSMTDEVHVTAEASVVDTKRTTTGSAINSDVMQKVPTTREPWQIINTAPGTSVNGVNVGGSASGQQLTPSVYGSSGNVQWNLEGGNITDMSSNSRPTYFNFDSLHDNPFYMTSARPLSTFAADVDTASYTNVRRFLTAGHLPPPDAVRVEEFVNYFRFAYPVPDSGHPVSITTEVGECPWAPDHKLVLVGLRAKPIDDRGVAGRNITLLLDVSGSMEPAERLPLIKTALRMFVDTLRDEDRVAIVVYAGATGLALPATSGLHRQRIHDAIENLHAGGSTNGAAGLELAYQVASQNFVRGGINRVILATDGDFNVGVTSREGLLSLIERERESGIFLSVLGVGTDNLKDSTMSMLADKGNGHYAYLDSLQEARRVLIKEGGATLETVAKDVKLQVEFNPAYVGAYRLLGYEKRLLAARDFNDDAKDGGEMGAGHTVTALYELVPANSLGLQYLASGEARPAVDPLKYQPARVSEPAMRNGEWLTVKVRYKLPDASTSELMTRAVTPNGQVTHLPFAAAVAEFGLLLRDARPMTERWDALLSRVRGLSIRDNRLDRAGFTELVDTAASLKRLTRER